MNFQCPIIRFMLLCLFISISSLEAMKRSRGPGSTESDNEEQAPTQRPCAAASASATDTPSVVECVICQETFAEAIDCRMLPCTHKFCIQCLEEYEKTNHAEKPPCPLCRSPFGRSTRIDPEAHASPEFTAFLQRLLELQRLAEEIGRGVFEAVERNLQEQRTASASAFVRPPLPLSSAVIDEETSAILTQAYTTQSLNAPIASLGGQTLLTYACAQSNFALAKFLVRTAGADTTRADGSGKTPLVILNSLPISDATKAIKRIIESSRARRTVPSTRDAAPGEADNFDCPIQ